MSSIHTPQKTDQGRVVDIPELIQTLGIAEGSQAILEETSPLRQTPTG